MTLLQSTKMSTESNSNCAICQDTGEEVASTLPCHHQFCLGCILRWTQRNPVCPLCRRTIVTVRFSDHGEDDYLETSITVPEELLDGSCQGGRALSSLDENSSHPPVVSFPSSPWDTPFQAMGIVLPEVWAELFRQQQHVLAPVRTWLPQRMETIYGDQWWLIKSTLCSIVHCLCTYGPDQEIMIQSLQGILEEHTVPVVQGTINIIVTHCSPGAQRLLHSHTATDEDEDENPAASSSFSSFRSFSSCPCMVMDALTSSPTGSVEEDEAGTMEAALCEGPHCSPPLPIPPEWDQPQEDLGQEVVLVARPCAQGSNCSPSTP